MSEQHGSSCNLPSARQSLGSDVASMVWKPLNLPLDILNSAIQQLPSQNFSIGDVIEVLWAVVLRKYTGNDQIAFNRLVQGHEVASCISMNLDQDKLESLADFPSLALLVAARSDGAREPFSLQEGSDAASCDTTVWITSKRDSKYPLPAASSGGNVIIEIQLDPLEQKSAATFWYRFPRIIDNEARNYVSTLKQSMRCLRAAYHIDIRDLDLISPENRDDLRRWMCSRAGPREPSMSLPDILWRAAQTRADAGAIEASDGSWSYRELVDACYSLSHHLREAGVESGDMVLLLREKSKWTVAGMIAILMSGAVCIPIDIRQPEERVHSIITSTNARFVLTSDAMATWTTPTSVRTICVPASPLLLDQSGTEQVPYIAPDATAFVFFTSGSTGIPKGVAQQHGAVAMTAEQICRAMRMDSSTRTFQFSSYSFDVSVGDIFATFWAGGCLCVPSEEQRLDALPQTINSMKATHICVTPTILAQLSPKDVPSLRQVTVGGESLTREQLQAWCPRIATIYGTTESVIWDTYHADLTVDDSPTNIGCAMGPTTTWVVDPLDAIKLVPIGAVGELLIGGPLLSRGYLYDEDRTKASFLERPSWLMDFVPDDEAGRLYRTGDLVRYNSDGTIQYLGRKDRQIKVNGQRVELGDIEYALRQSFPDGTACAAEMIRPDLRQGQEVLAAFIGVPDSALGASSWSLSSIRSKLTKLLPMYMIPSVFVPVQGGLPTTPTGKVDRPRLLQMGASLTPAELLQDLDNDCETLRDPIMLNERLLQRLYADALGIRDYISVSMNTNFFQCGGTSIHAMKLVTLARNQGFSLSVIDVFENPRLADLTTILRRSAAGTVSGQGTCESVPPFSLLPSDIHLEDIRTVAASCCRTTPAQVRDVFPCTLLQEGLLALSSKNPGDYIYQAAIELPPTVDLEKFREAYRSAADRIPILRCRAFALPQANHRIHMAVIDEPEEWRTDSILDRCSDTDMQQLTSCRLGDRLVRCSLVVEPTQKQYFVWTIHHALFDGWSLSLMLDEIENQLLGDAISPPLPFQNFVHYLQNALDQKACERFWKSRLEGATRLHFPPSLPSIYQPSERIATVRRAVAIHFPYTGVTPTTVIQGAWAVLLSQHAASSDVVFGATVIGRHAAVPGIEHIAGPTIATVPFRAHLDFTQPISGYLQQLQLDAVRTVPYEQLGLSEIAKVSFDAKEACSFQTLLVIQPPEEDIGDSDRRLFDRSQVNVLGTLRTYAVTLQCWLRDSGSAEFQMEIDETLLDQCEGERLLAQLEVILQGLCTGSLKDAALATVLPCSEADMAQISHWNVPTPVPAAENVLQLISKQVAAYPDRLAVDAWDGSLTYRQLDLHESQPTIIICLEKSHLAVVAFLAVLKAGGVCVLVDPSHPSQRVQSIIKRSDACLALTDEAQSDRLSQWTRTMTISKVLNPSSASRGTLVPRLRGPTHDACIVFTSGSTGEPKAICWSHETVAVTALEIGARFHLSPRSRVFQFSSYAFDVSIHETMATLVRGGCICVPSEQSRQDALEQTIVSFNASTIILTPSVAQVLNPQHMPCLEAVVFCGEPLPMHVARDWSKSMAVYNWYGPAECSLATCCRIGDSWRAGRIGVGASTSTWIVHHQDHDILQPIGAVGELLLQGPCVASRYAQDKVGTAQSFINPPRWWQQCRPEVTGTQMYKTGDLVRYASDGSLILLGRKDMQVKVRGQRVELGEIQGRLQEILGADTAVTVDLVNIQDHPGAPTLAAFVQTTAWNDIPHNDHIASVDWTHTVQARLSDTLPTWMVPTIFIIVRQFPRTSTGKVDRRKLQTLGAAWIRRSVNTASSVTPGGTWEPSSEAEAVLGELWMRVLGLSPDQLTSNAHFIRLGGNSIDAMHLAAAAGSMGYSLSVRDVLKWPCLADLARHIRRVSPENPVAEQPTTAPFSLIRDTIDVAIARHDAASQCRVRPDQVEDMFPCTALQTALLALTSKNPGDYVSQNIYHIQGDLGLFKSSWEAVVASTPVLRTRIVDLGKDNFFQIIIDELVEWNDAYETLDDYLHHDQRLPMGLGTSLVRWGILPGQRDSSSSFTFIWTIHHSLYDGWSFRAILDQVERVYTKRPLAPTAPFQEFIKYAMDPKRELAATNFWKQRLDGAVAPQFPMLPSSQYQPRATSTMEYRACQSPAAGRANHANYTNYTLTTLLRAAWSLVLARYTRSTDVVFGATVLGRQAPVPGITDMIGPTIATTPVRVRWAETDTVQNLLQTVHQDGLDMIPFEQLGLQKIRRLGPDPQEACRFQTMLIVQPPKEQRQNCAGLFDKFQGDESFGAFSSTALMLRCSLRSTTDKKHNDISDIRFHLDFDPAVVEEQQARRILCQMDHTLSELSSASPSTRIGDLQLLNKSDLETIILWNKKTPEPIYATVLDLFRDIVQQFPTAPAVHAWDAEFSYEELDRQATYVAHRLVSLGLQSLQRVPLYFEKSAWTVVAILGVLMAGGTAVLLEPSQPEERLRLIVDRINASLIVTSARNKDSARRLLPSSPVVAVDESVAKSTALSGILPPPRIDSSSPVYIVFTSGSTGVPKGVVITHGNMCSALKQRQSILPYGPGDRVLDSVSYAFDVCWGNILFTLCSGACLCVPATLDDIAVSLNQFRVTVVGTIPSIARLLDCSQFPTLKTIILGGEPAHLADLEDWVQRVDVFNSYGPAECTVSVCLGRLNGEDRVHIGRGMGATLWIVDDTTNDTCLASIGSIGELWLEGPQVGLGYLEDPGNSAAAFIDGDPAWLSALPASIRSRLPTQHNRRFYRTGDLAQYYPDGAVRLLGRRDTQVKLRGQRIELEEVEHHVKYHLPKGIELAAEVIVPRSSPTSQFLVMFVVPDPNRGLPDDAIRGLRQAIRVELAQVLPSYMCPSAYVPLARLPRLAAGKVNRSKLREIGGTLTAKELSQPMHRGADTKRVTRPPRTSTEKKLRELWATTLGLEPCAIDVEDSFLQLDGGDSISVMRLVRLAQEHGMSLSAADVFSHPMLCDLATVAVFGEASTETVRPFSLWQGPWTVGRLRQEAAAHCDVRPDQIEDIFPCTALQEGLLALTSRDTNLYTCREVFKLHDHIDIPRMRQAWDIVADSMPILRTRVIDLPPHGLHQVIVNEPIPWDTQDTPQPFKLGSRLAHWALIRKGQSMQLVWTIHHSLYDGWSLPRVLKQVERAYYQEPLVQYLSMQPFIHYLSTVDEAASRTFWNGQLAESPPPSFPTLPSASYVANATEGCSCFLPDFRWPVGVDVTPSIWVRAAWALLIGHIVNTDDIVFGATVSGRQLPIARIQDVIGPTIATVPVRVRLDWGASIRDFVCQLQHQATDMIPFEQVGLHRLHRISEDCKQGSQFRTLLNVQPAQTESSTTRLWTRMDNEPNGQFDNFALILDCELRNSGVFLQLDFDKKIISPKQAERLVHQLETVLLQFSRKTLDLSKRLADFHPISHRDLLDIWQWNAVVPEEITVCLHEMIHNHVAQRPQALAVDAWDGQFTYGTLDQHSTSLASYLQNEKKAKVGPGTVIALCFEKSKWTVVAALAVMKTGSAFTLIDTSHPEERLHTIVSQVNQRLVISSALNADLAARLADEVVVVDHENASRWPPPRPLRIRALPNSELYVVFTSGSTGTPKGAVITHSNFASAVKHQGPFLGYNTQTRVYDFASYSFDIAVSNLLHCLAAGGCLCIPSDAERKHSQLAESMRRMQVNLVDLTPSVARTLDPTAVPTLKTLVLGGEAASRSDIVRWAPYVRILNGIGQAECTVTTTMAEMDPAVPGTPGIGRALGTNTWIVSPTDHHQLAAIGAVGELLVEGPLVGAGYLNDEVKTAASFIYDPRWLGCAPGPGGKGRRGRLYKTGDLVRYDAVGGLQFVGRKDAQVKIRGQRIELEEVEYHVQRLLSSLGMEASVAAEALVLSGTHIRSAVLAVFVCPATLPSSDDDPDDGFRALDPSCFPPSCRDELNARLESELPSAMVPSLYVPVNGIPLAPTGKTDRRRLKAFGASLTAEDLAKLRGVKNKPKRPPSTASERQMRGLWAEILAIPADCIGIDDNFIQHGGDSISAMRLVSLARGRGLFLDARKLFTSASTLADLCAKPSQASSPATVGHRPPFSQLQTSDIADFLMANIAPHIDFPVSSIVDVFPVTDFQAECISAALQQKPPSYWNYFYIDLPMSNLTIGAVSAACQAVAMHLPILRSVFVPYDGDFLQVVTKDQIPDFVWVWSTAEDIATASMRLAREDWLKSNVRPGTLFSRFMLVLAEDESRGARLIIRMSHALYDGISLGLLLHAIVAAIEGRQLPSVGSFASFVQHSFSMRDEASRYWGRLLSGSSMTGIPRAPLANDVGESTPYTIRNTVRWQTPLPEGITAATFCTACWAAVMAFTTQQADVVFGRLVSGRGATLGVITDPVAGPCVNVVPVRVQWPPSNGRKLYSPHEVLATIQQQQLDGLPFESTGLSQIIKSCTNWPADAAFGSVFQYQNIDETPSASLNGAPVQLDVIPMNFWPKQLWVLVKPLAQEIEVILFGTTAIMAQEHAQILGDRFCKYVEMGGKLQEM
ncbi:nonribosomal peptide synthetase 8 [Aspergillus udagawae]|uniref:Nonribosomal peptide synthetase 8 n=1 Tax=Aspergillus udagawae TaxID=91492 RepID=A0A8H3SB26_9EURO|nr:nonribosomal peptide synthetase 8 [Aspergillus udagawae]